LAPREEGVETFASLLKGFRAATGLSQQEVAEGAGLSPAAVGALERGDASRRATGGTGSR